MEQKHFPCEEVDVHPFAYAISLIDGKWEMHILFYLRKKGTLRYSELKRALAVSPTRCSPKEAADQVRQSV